VTLTDPAALFCAVRFLTGLEGLRVLWLCDNPCVENSKYRKAWHPRPLTSPDVNSALLQFVIHSLRGLTKLDNSDITEEERAAADQEDFADLIADAQEAASEQAAASPPGSPVPGAGAERPSSPLTATPKTERRGNILKAISFLLDDLDEQGEHRRAVLSPCFGNPTLLLLTSVHGFFRFDGGAEASSATTYKHLTAHAGELCAGNK